MLVNPNLAFALALIAALSTLLVLGLVETRRLIQILGHRYDDLYRSMGSPTLIFNNSVSSSARLVAFVWSKRVKTLGDSQLERCIQKLRLIQGLYGILFALTLMLFFLAGAASKAPL